MITLKDYTLYKTSGEMCTLEEIANGEDAYAIGKICSKYKDAKEADLRTARIVEIDNRVIVTRNGISYALECMHPEYREFLLFKAAELL